MPDKDFVTTQSENGNGEDEVMAEHQAQLERFSTDSKLPGTEKHTERAISQTSETHSRTQTLNYVPTNAATNDPVLLEPVKSKVNPDLLSSSPPPLGAFCMAQGVMPPEYHGELIYGFHEEERFEYLGWMRVGGQKEGLWERNDAIRWKKRYEMHEYHGEFRAGRPHGKGMHMLPDGSRVTGYFENGCPMGTAVLVNSDGIYYDVEYNGKVSCLEWSEGGGGEGEAGGEGGGGGG